jgi:hypothetical protein
VKKTDLNTNWSGEVRWEMREKWEWRIPARLSNRVL